ncbi:EamA family transporter [Actinomadura rudentiformis]|uniref:EamA family transporter n=1 Tax=Actinomadura rudentiformis TaxID=359158 RepID=A0A6H9YRN9_9ACTN|nr:EamA family transporter [Actinomadura rudentiformis]
MSVRTLSQRALSRRTPSRPAPVRVGGTADILVAACLWGTTGTVRTFADGASNVSIAASRIVLGGSLLLALALVTARGGLFRLLSTPRDRTLVGLGAVAIAVYQAAFFVAVARTGVAVGTVVTIGSAPAFAGLLGALTRQARLTPRWLAATAGAVAGCAALVGGGESAGVEPIGVGLALLSGLAYAVYASVASAFITRGEDDRAVVGMLFGVAAIVLLPVLAMTGPGWMATPSGALIILYLGGVTTAGGYMLFARGLRTTPATTATTLTLAEPAVAAVLGVVVLDEQLGGLALAGLALLAASLLLLILPSRK